MVKGRGGHLGKMIIDSPLLAVQAAVPIHELVPILATLAVHAPNPLRVSSALLYDIMKA